MTKLGVLAGVVVALAGLGNLAHAADLPDLPPRLTSDDPAAQTAWIRSWLDTEDWTLAGFNSGNYYFVSAETSPLARYPLVLDWVRFETSQPRDSKVSSLSTLWLEQVDCDKRKVRAVRSIMYQFNNLRGPIVLDQDTPDADFVTAKPGSINEGVLGVICQSAAGGAR